MQLHVRALLLFRKDLLGTGRDSSSLIAIVFVAFSTSTFRFSPMYLSRLIVFKFSSFGPWRASLIATISFATSGKYRGPFKISK